MASGSEGETAPNSALKGGEAARGLSVASIAKDSDLESRNLGKDFLLVGRGQHSNPH